MTYLFCEMHNSFWEVRQFELGNTWCTNKLSITEAFRMEYCWRWVWEASSVSHVHLLSYHTPQNPWVSIHVYIGVSRGPQALWPSSLWRQNIHQLDWACNRHLPMVGLPNATGQAGKTEPGDFFHLRQSTPWLQWNGRSFPPGSFPSLCSVHSVPFTLFLSLCSFHSVPLFGSFHSVPFTLFLSLSSVHSVAFILFRSESERNRVNGTDWKEQSERNWEKRAEWCYQHVGLQFDHHF